MVQWVTRDKGKPAVRWAIQQQDQHVQVAAGDSLTYRRADMCGSPANSSGWMEPGWMHGAVMSGLQPSTRYVYWYGDEVRAGGMGRGGVPVKGCHWRQRRRF